MVVGAPRPHTTSIGSSVDLVIEEEDRDFELVSERESPSSTLGSVRLVCLRTASNVSERGWQKKFGGTKSRGKEESLSFLMTDRGGDGLCCCDGMESSEGIIPTEGVITFGSDDDDDECTRLSLQGAARRLVSLYRGGLQGFSIF